MMRYAKYLLMTCLFLYMSQHLIAQNCDKYYNDGLRKQTSQTVESQNAAIASFKKAMACYDSAAKKQLCQNQIAKCSRTIKYLGEQKKKAQQRDSSKNKPQQNIQKTVADINPQKDSVPNHPPTETNEKVQKPEKAYLDANPSKVEFKKKGGVETIKVRCGIGFSWSVEDVPDWLEVTTNDNIMRIVCSQNKTGTDRTAVLHIVATGNQRDVTVIQYCKRHF